MWLNHRALFWRIVAHTGGRDGESDDEKEPQAEKGTPYCTLIALGLTIGTGGSILLRGLSLADGAALDADGLQSAQGALGDEGSGVLGALRPLEGIGAGLCASLVLSGCLAALPAPEEEPGRVPKSRLAMAKRQIVADVWGYESDVRLTLLASALVVGLHTFLSATAAALRGALAAALVLPACAACGSCGTHVFALCVVIPFAAAAGALQECLLGLLVGGALVARFWIRLLQDKFLYHPRCYEAVPVWGKAFELGGQLCMLEKVSYAISRAVVGDFEQTAFLLRPQSRDVSVLWVVHGGNSMLATDWLGHLDHVLRQIPPCGIGFLLVDYPGYGFNAGRPSPASVLAASKAALGATLPMFETAPSVNLLGHSLGSAACAQLAAELRSPPGHVVLSAPFLDIPTMAMRILGGLLPDALQPCFPPLLRWLVPHQWHNTASVPEAAKAGWRVSVIHGSADELVPCLMGAALHQLAAEAAFVGKTVEAHSLGAEALNGARGRAEAALGDRIQVRFGPEELKAVRQVNLRFVDPGPVGGSANLPQTTFNEVPGAGHNDVLVRASPLLAEYFRLSACNGSGGSGAAV